EGLQGWSGPVEGGSTEGDRIPQQEENGVVAFFQSFDGCFRQVFDLLVEGCFRIKISHRFGSNRDEVRRVGSERGRERRENLEELEYVHRAARIPARICIVDSGDDLWLCQEILSSGLFRSCCSQSLDRCRGEIGIM